MFRHLGVKPEDNFYLLAIVLLAVYIGWFLVFNEEASAPPIIINPTSSKKELKKHMIKKPGNSGNGITDTAGLVTDNEPKTNVHGGSGLAYAGLAQPCVTVQGSTVNPNLPTGYTQQTCDQNKGLECITGIYQGGGICLKIVNKPCTLKTDCGPEAEFCLNNICQTRGEVINKSCKTDSDCKGVLKNLNHVCDPDSKRCVFDIWPNDSGCTDKSQCKYNSRFPDSVRCLRSGSVIKIMGKYEGTSIKVVGSDVSDLNLIKNSSQKLNKSGFPYVTVIKNETKSYEGRILITNINNNNVTLDNNIFSGSQGTCYLLEFGTEKDGICLVKYPEGAPIPLVEGSKNTKYECTSGSSFNNYCVEIGRESKDGSLGELCNFNNDISCKEGLLCTYDNNVVNGFGSMIKSYHVSADGSSINKQVIKNIGRCKIQERTLYETCSDNCIKPYVCLNEKDINGKEFRYCGNEWDIMNDVSRLSGCPTENFELIGPEYIQCKAKKQTNGICFDDNDCSSGNCTANPSYSFRKYDPFTNKYTSFNNKFTPTFQPHILVSNEKDENNNPLFMSYYYYSQQESSWIFTYNTQGGNDSVFDVNNVITVKFEGQPESTEFSLTYLGGTSYQLNACYMLEHQYSRKRQFSSPSNYNFYNAGLRPGTCVYFENEPDIFTINYGNGYVSHGPTGHNILALLKVDKVTNGTGTSVNISTLNGDMITYDNRFAANTNISFTALPFQAAPPRFFAIESCKNSLTSGDTFIYKEGNPPATNCIKYSSPTTFSPGNLGNSPSFDPNNYSSLTEGTCYYSIIFKRESDNPSIPESIQDEIYFTEDYEGINTTPIIDGSQRGVFGINRQASPEFNIGNSYMEMKEVYGYHILPIKFTRGTRKDVVIKNNKNYVQDKFTNNMTFNKPVGYFTDTTSINSVITKNNILLTYEYNSNNVQVLSLDYSLDSPKKNISCVETENGSCYIYYDINNSFRVPNLKVPSGTCYSSVNAPYTVDKVRYFENNDSSTDTVSFLSTYQNIRPDNPLTSVSNISTMRKLNLGTSMPNSGGFNFNNNYFGLDNVSPSRSMSDLTTGLPFGSTGFYSLSPIKKQINISNSKNNFFLEGTDSIFFRNQNDIDVILKYGANELVISYNKFNNSIVIVGIKEYNIDNNGIETLEVQTAFFLSLADPLDSPGASPKLYFNNIYPVTSTISSYSAGLDPIPTVIINDGRNIISSTVPSNNASNFPTQKTNYNKFLFNVHNSSNTVPNRYSFFECFITPHAYDSHIFNDDNMSHEYITFSNRYDLTTIQTNLGENKYQLEVVGRQYEGNGKHFLPPTTNIIYVINNQYLSSTTLSSQYMFLSNSFYYNTFTVYGKKSFQNNILDRSYGGILMKNNTFPFYTGLPGNEGMLDETYLKEIKWPYWIKNLNIGTIKINKILLTYDPGNMENNMFYYCFAEVAGVNMLLYFSTNFSVNSIKESRAVPIVISNLEKMYEGIEMVPYDKNLILFSSHCS